MRSSASAESLIKHWNITYRTPFSLPQSASSQHTQITLTPISFVLPFAIHL